MADKNPKLTHFEPHEFTYKGENVYDKMDKYFLILLDQIRDFAGVVMTVNSSWRLKKNDDTDSDHHTGEAVDIKCTDSHTRFCILEACFLLGICRIGIGKNYIHIGHRKDLPQSVCWHYYPL